MLRKGEVAPDFPIGDSSLYRMLEQRAVAVFFFPKAFTPGCTREAQAFREECSRLRDAACDVIGVSRDSQETSDRFREALGLPFPLVGDPGGEVLRAYKVNWPVLGLARRVTYLVGKTRKVRLAFHSEFSPDAHVKQTCAALTQPET